LLLTPTILKPLPPSSLLDDKRILNIGMFHSGSWRLRKTEETASFLDWWCTRTIDRAKFDLCNGMCLDQLWLNYAPVWVRNSSAITTPSWHMGLHSLLNSTLSVENNTYQVNGAALVSVDFAGLSSYHPIWSDHVKLAKQYPIFMELFKNYARLCTEYISYADGLSSIPGQAHRKSISQRRKGIIERLKAVTKFINQVDV
jgi:hypothetical protein